MTNEKDNKDIEEIDCTEAIDNLYAYLDGEISNTKTIDKLERHLEHCHSCFTRSQVENALTSHMKKESTNEAPESLQKRLREMIDKF